MMRICLNDLLNQLSYAIDCVEMELIGVTSFHSKRVAAIAAQVGRYLKLDERSLVNLAALSLMHDNALAECIQVEYNVNNEKLNKGRHFSVSEHCAIGDENMKRMPFYVKDAILYHHENADGSGPFGMTYDKTPIFARIIHIADAVDIRFDLSEVDEKKYKNIRRFLSENKKKLFDGEMTGAFLKAFNSVDSLQIGDVCMEKNIITNFNDVYWDCSNSQLMDISRIFSKIVDYKSEFTSRHSTGIAQKAMEMGKFYGCDEDKQTKLYMAGALHDIGKLVIGNDILEKPGRLTDEEYDNIKNHAEASYIMLKSIRGMEEITDWASTHHEKLDGSGYPFGKKADELGHEQRLLACLDIYQALIEERPYKSGSSHEEAMSILREMAEDGKIDGSIVEDIDARFGGAADGAAG